MSPITALSILLQPFHDGSAGSHGSLLAFSSRATWQLNATCASSQSSRWRETISPDQFCPMTSGARLSTLCPRSSKEDEPSLSVQSSTSLFQSGLFFSNHISTCLPNHKKGHCLTTRHLLLPSCANQSRCMLSMSPQERRTRNPPSS